MARQLWRKRVKRAFEQIGEQEIGLRLPELGMVEAVCRNHTDQGGDAVLARVLGGGCGGYRVAVARDDFSSERLGGGDGEDAAAGAEIDDSARGAALEEIVEREQAAARARVMRRAEGLARVDLDGEADGAAPLPRSWLPWMRKRPATTLPRLPCDRLTQSAGGSASI